MSDRVLVNPGCLSDIADAIRAKNGESGTYTPAQMADAIAAITTGGGADLSELEIYVADFLAEPPTVTEGALNGFHRTLVS